MSRPPLELMLTVATRGSRVASLGPMLDSVLGAVGGGIGGQLLPMIVSSLQGGGATQNAGLFAVVGALLPYVVSMLKKRA